MKGRFTPLNSKSAPLTANCDMVTLVEPELVRTSGLVVLCPTATLPKLMLVALGVIWPAMTACAVKPKVTEFCGAPPAIATVADGEPAACGVN